MNPKQLAQEIMMSMSQGRVRLLFDAMDEEVTWRWMGARQWSRTFTGKRTVIDTFFGGNAETLESSSSVQVHGVHGDGNVVVVEHSGRNELDDGRRYDNNYCWVFEFEGSVIRRVREYMDTQLVTETLGPDQTT